MLLELPAPHERFDIALEDGACIRVRRHGNADGVRLFLSHGNGFAINGYLPFWEHFLGRFEIILFDFRNHGENVPATPANHTYEQLARDLERVFQGVTAKFGAKKSAGMFHSMSGRTAMKHALEIGFRWDALVLFDPPNVPPPGHPAYAGMAAFEARLTVFAKSRRRRFASPDELAADFAASRMGQSWVAGAHALMARSVLRRNRAGDGYVLVCDPENEAGIYAAAMTMNLWPRASDFRGPVKLIGADPDLKGGPPTGRANQALGTENGYDYGFVPGTGHMLQIEKPEDCARLAMAFLQDCGLGGWGSLSNQHKAG
jgi:pimeloyl-ACP methyl ester carboxylesterase